MRLICAVVLALVIAPCVAGRQHRLDHSLTGQEAVQVQQQDSRSQHTVVGEAGDLHTGKPSLWSRVTAKVKAVLFNQAPTQKKFKNTGRGPKKSDRIAIVGAGPAGLHMATRLQKFGYKKVTILEKTNRIGGKSYTVYRNRDGDDCKLFGEDGARDAECIPHDMGTCFMHNGYASRLYGLFKHYGMSDPSLHDGRSMFVEQTLFSKEHGFPYQFKHAIDMPTFTVGIVGKQLIQKKRMTVEEISDHIVSDAVVAAVAAYIKLHKKYFQTSVHLIPESKPSAEVRRVLSMPFLQFLVDNDLEPLTAILALAYSAQGYGYIKTISTHYGMTWITPELLHGYSQQGLRLSSGWVGSALRAVGKVSTHLRNGLTWGLTGFKVGFHADPTASVLITVPDGWERFWRLMYKKDRPNVKLGVNITSIHRNLDNKDKPVEIEYTDAEGTHKQEYDFLIYTPNPVTDFSGAGVVKDVQPEEKRLLASMNTFQITTTFYQAKPMPGYSDEKSNSFIAYFTDPILLSRNNEWYGDRHDAAAYGGTKEARQNFGTQQRNAFQFSDTLEVPRDTMPYTLKEQLPAHKRLEEQLAKDMQHWGVPADSVKVLTDAVDSTTEGPKRNKEPQRKAQFAWPYFPHWESDMIQEGAPWQLEALQGKHKTWYSGSFASFESVLNVVDNNCRLLHNLLGHECEWM